jgi:hypothetical protein
VGVLFFCTLYIAERSEFPQKTVIAFFTTEGVVCIEKVIDSQQKRLQVWIVDMVVLFLDKRHSAFSLLATLLLEV